MRILLVEDDLNLSDSITFQLEKEGFVMDTCYDGVDALHWIGQRAHELILLDRMIPGVNGLNILKKIRNDGIETPVILITALGELNDKIDGFETGADDYLVKPFAFEELLARIRSISRRPMHWQNNHTLDIGDISFDPYQKQLFKGTLTCSLSKREAELLEIFLRNPDQILPRDMLLYRVWGPDAGVEDGNLDNYIHFLRRRLKALESKMTLKTIRGVGYRMEE